MDIYVRRRERNPSRTLFVTFVLGVGIGLSIGYAIFRAPSGAWQTAEAPAQPPAAEEASAQPAAPAEPAVELTTEPTTEPTVEPPVEPAAGAPVPETTVAAAAPPSPEPARAPEDLWPGRFLVIAVEGEALDDDTAKLLHEVRPAGVVLRDVNLRGTAQTAELVRGIKAAAGLGPNVFDLPLLAVAQEGGAVNPLGIDKAPGAAELAAAKDRDAAFEAGRAAGEAARARGIGVLLAPMLDVLPEGAASGAMAPRLFGSNQALAATLGIAFADGVLEGGAVPVAKYYPGLGQVRKVDDAEVQVLDAELKQLADLLYPFNEAATHGIAGLLAGPATVPRVDSESLRPAAVSPVLIKGLLRERWNYGGVVLADNVSQKAIASTRPAEKAAVEALAAGCDAVLFLDPAPDQVRAVVKAIEDAIGSGTLAESGLRESVARIEGLRMLLGAPETSAPELVAEQESEEEEEYYPEGPAPGTGTIEFVGSVPAAGLSAEEAEALASVAGASPAPPPAPAQAPEPPVAPRAPEQPAAAEPGPAPSPETPAAPAPPSPVPAHEPEEAAPSTEAPPAAGPPAASPATAEAASASPEPPPGAEKVMHTVVKGDTLSRIAAMYGVKAADVRKWNKMPDDTVKLGFTIVIYKAKGSAPSPAP